MNIFSRELKSHTKALIIWSVAMIFLIFAGMNKYAALSDMAGGANDMMKSLPQWLQSYLGFGKFDMSTAIGDFGMLFTFVVLVAAVHAVMLGSGIISKEENEKTSEFLLTKPVSRSAIISMKLLSAAAMALILNIVTGLSTIATMVQYSNEAHFFSVIKLMGGMFIIQLIFLSIGAFFSCTLKRPKLASAISTGVMLVFYLLTAVIDISGTDWLRYFTPFKYFDAYPILTGGFSPVYPVLSAAIILVCFFFAYPAYRKRDMKC